MKPLNAEYANGIARICRRVVFENMTVEQATKLEV
jgi:hypothetical protein